VIPVFAVSRSLLKPFYGVPAKAYFGDLHYLIAGSDTAQLFYVWLALNV